MGGKRNRGKKGGGGNSHDRAIKTEKEHANKAPETEVVNLSCGKKWRSGRYRTGRARRLPFYLCAAT
jgi:hypothetical protein